MTRINLSKGFLIFFCFLVLFESAIFFFNLNFFLFLLVLLVFICGYCNLRNFFYSNFFLLKDKDKTNGLVYYNLLLKEINTLNFFISELWEEEVFQIRAGPYLKELDFIDTGTENFFFVT